MQLMSTICNLGLASIAALALGAPALAQQKVIKIGVVVPLSGPASYFGVQDRQGFDLALEQLNKGGVSGYQLQLQIEDGACNPLTATNAVKRLLETFKPDIVIGEECSDASLAIMPTLEAAKVPLLNAGSTTVKLTESGYKYVFRIFPTAKQQGDDMAKHAIEKLKAKTAVLLYEKSNAGIDNAELFAAPFEKMGGKILAKIDFGRDVNDFTSIATRVAGLGPVDIIPSFQLEGQGVKLTQALAQAGVTKGGGGKAIQMGSIWLPWGFDQKAGKAATGYIRIVQFDPTEKRKMVQDFVAAFKAKFGADQTPTHINAHAYDAIQLIAEAVRRGAKDPESFREKMATIKSFEVTTGKINFDAKGQTTDLSILHYVETQADGTWNGLAWTQ